MEYELYQVNAFTTRQFGGNPAAVAPLEEWLPEEIMQAVAAENNLSETAFFVPEEGETDSYGLRWFTPTVEVDLCGHATLATAHVLFNELFHTAEALRFQTRSGELVVRRSGDNTGEELCMDFPAHPLAPAELDAAVVAALGGSPTEAFESPFGICLYGSEAEVKALAPDMQALEAASDVPVIATAPGDEVDFVSRFFGPQVGVGEDPVTGSAHCALTPLWAERLGKTRLSARQVSARGGELDCELKGDRVLLRGSAQTFMRGRMQLG